MSMTARIVTTFFIGLVAGVCPFLFLQLLPVLLDPTQTIVVPNYLAIVVTGVLVGAISAIIFAKTFEAREPSEIFFYALGVPAILVATVSNLGTKFEAARTVEVAQQVASNAVLRTVPPPIGAIEIQEVAPPPAPAKSGLAPRGGVAWAAEGRVTDPLGRTAQVDEYVVVIGRYPTAEEAWKAVAELREQRLKTERYVPKSLRVFRGGNQAYYVAYAAPLPREEALRLYQLIRINDPALSPQVVRQASR
jgi:hypothetical protein